MDIHKRVNSIDVTRGIVMIIMALDHVRDMIHVDSISQSPTDLATTTPVLFFTRWITYLCAPTFVFLAGSSAYLAFKQRGNTAAGRVFLLKRGLYLIVLEFVIVGFGLFFDAGFHTLLFEVIAAIGSGFIILALLLALSPRIIALIGILIIATHNLLPNIIAANGELAERILLSLFKPTAVPFGERVFVMAYPPLPWTGIMLTGFAAGSLFTMAPEKRRKLFLKTGGGCILLFIILRTLNFYGDTISWTPQKSDVYSFLSFMNITKYPPSLLFCLVTLGIMFLILAMAEGRKGSSVNITATYGKVPMFYFLVHFYLVHLLLLLILAAQGYEWKQFDFAGGNFGRLKNSPGGLPLWTVYLVWIGVVAVLYLPCRWFGRYKATHTHWWLKYV